MPRWAQPPTKMRTPNPLVRLRMCIDATKAEARLACTFSVPRAAPATGQWLASGLAKRDIAGVTAPLVSRT
jgi:hypothetical protein